MTTAWVAGSVRACAMAHRRLGDAGARALAARPGLADAVDGLSATSYGRDVRSGQTLADAQRAVAATLLWNVRVLGGWVPRGDARVLRVLAAGFEIANVDERLRELAGSDSELPFDLGSLATSWSRIAPGLSVVQLRETLTRSAWGDPGADSATAIHLGMRLSWARRVAARVPPARPWAGGAAALLVAREVVVAGQRPTSAAVRMAAPLLGSAWVDASTVPGLAASLPRDARWALAAVDDPVDLWRAEAAWWARLDQDGHALLRRPVTTPGPVIGAVAVLAVDAWRVRAALAVAARGGPLRPQALEVFDAVA